MLDILFFMAIVVHLFCGWSQVAIYLENKRMGFRYLKAKAWVNVLTVLSFAYMLGYVITQWVM